MSQFTHLHVHSHYSLLNALPKILDLVKKAKEYGMDALALTDDCNLYGAIEFYKACKKEDIKPIIGIDAFLAMRTRHDKEAGLDSKRPRLVLLAENTVGYKNLIKLVTMANLEGFYYKPRIDNELLEQYHEGLIVIIPAQNSPVTNFLKEAQNEKAEELLDWYKKIFGTNSVFLEITHHPNIAGHTEHIKRIKACAEKTHTHLVATHNVYYLSPDDKQARQTLLSVQTSGDIGGRDFGSEDDFSFINTEQMETFFKDTPEAIENTKKISNRIHIDIDIGTWYFPDFPIPENKTHDSVLREFVFNGLKDRNIEQTPDILTRIEYELDIIKTKGYSRYFLVVADLLKFAHKEGILTTIRGSVAGSLVTYLSGITTVNPIEYDIPFERFLNPERPSAPDIDMDFADTRRDEVIEYARRKYGEDKVAQIGTFGTMMARGAVRDVSRALGFPYEKGDVIAKLIPMGSQGFPMTINHALEITDELKTLYKKDTDSKKIIDMAKKIEGCARHIGVHAAGVVISPEPLINHVPVQYDTKGDKKIITQYDMYSVGEDGIGLLKFDFLGLKNLSILADAVNRVKKIKQKEIHIEDIPLDDKNTFAMLARGETIGLFQLNGSGMTRFLKDLQPSTIHDINAMVALYRPGPMQFIPLYIERKHNPTLVTYFDKTLEPILKKTFGILIYQDDLLLIAVHVAGYSWGEADKFRKAVGKKNPEEMAKQKIRFISGCVEHSNWPKEKAEKLWIWIEPFAAYGFNKAHSVSYGRVAYQTAYMKANFPAIYMSAVLTADSGDVEKIAEIITECKRMKIEILPPDVNESYSDFTVVPGKESTIRFGLTTIKNFGAGIAREIIDNRKEHGHFLSLTDFLSRIASKNLNKKSLEALILSGALDSLGTRGIMYESIEMLLAYHKEESGKALSQDSLFAQSETELSLPTTHTLSQERILVWEKELLGLYISGHPLDKHTEALNKLSTTIQDTKKNTYPGTTHVIAGIIESIRPIVTKKNATMAFVRIADKTGSMEIVFFPKVYQEFHELLNPDHCIAIKGKLSNRNDEISILAEKVKVL